MLKSYEAIYDHGQIDWLSDAPTIDQARIIVIVLDETPILPNTRRIPPLVKDSITFHDDDPEEAEAALDTTQQIAGDADAFRI